MKTHAFVALSIIVIVGILTYAYLFRWSAHPEPKDRSELVSSSSAHPNAPNIDLLQSAIAQEDLIRKRIGIEITVVDENGNPILGALAYTCQPAARFIRRTDSISDASDANGKLWLAEEIRTITPQLQIVVAASGFVTKLIGSSSKVDSQTCILSSGIPVTIEVSSNGLPVSGANIAASSGDFLLSEASNVQTALGEGGIYVGNTDAQGRFVMTIPAHAQYVVKVAKDGYVATKGNQVFKTLDLSLKVELRQIFGLYVSIPDDAVLDYSVKYPPYLELPPQCASYLQEVMGSLRGESPNVVALGGVLRREVPHDASVDVQVFTSRRGTQRFKGSIRALSSMAKPEVITLGVAPSDVGVMCIVVHDSNGVPINDDMTLYATPTKSDARHGGTKIKVIPNSEIKLPPGQYTIGAEDNIIAANMPRRVIVTVESGQRTEQVMNFSERVFKVTLPISDVNGHPVRFARVLARKSSYVGAKRPQISRGVLDLQNTQFWLTQGTWEVEIIPPLCKKRLVYVDVDEGYVTGFTLREG